MGVRIALLVLTIFATLWAWAAVWLSGAARSLILLPIALSIALLLTGWRGSGMFPARGPHVGKVVVLWSTIEILALVVTANALEYVHRADLMLPAAAIIVGLHFFPLARGIPARLYFATGGGLLLAGIVGLVVPPNERAAVVGFSAALVLWATALAIVVRVRSAAADQSSLVRA